MFYKKLKINGTEYPLAVNITGVGAPTSATEASVGMFYMDETNGEVYKRTPEGWVQETFVFANALRGNASGSAVSIDDEIFLGAKVQATIESVNLFDINKRSIGSIDENGDLVIPNSIALFYKYDFKKNTQYTLSGYVKQQADPLGNVRFRFVYTDGTEDEYILLTSHTSSWVYMTNTSKPNKTLDGIYCSYGATGKMFIKGGELMLNEGATALPYVPNLNGTVVNVLTHGANLLPYPYHSMPESVHGVSCQYTNGGAITMVGTADRDIWLYLGAVSVRAGEAYSLSGCPKNGGVSTYRLVADGYIGDENNNTLDYLFDSGTGNSINIKTSDNLRVYVHIVGGVTVNATFRPMFTHGMDIVPFEPFEGQTVTTEVGATVEIEPIAPHMTICTDHSDAVVSVEYNKDTNKVIEKLVQAIISLGGTV